MNLVSSVDTAHYLPEIFIAWAGPIAGKPGTFRGPQASHDAVNATAESPLAFGLEPAPIRATCGGSPARALRPSSTPRRVISAASKRLAEQRLPRTVRSPLPSAVCLQGSEDCKVDRGLFSAWCNPQFVVGTTAIRCQTKGGSCARVDRPVKLRNPAHPKAPHAQPPLKVQLWIAI